MTESNPSSENLQSIAQQAALAAGKWRHALQQLDEIRDAELSLANKIADASDQQSDLVQLQALRQQAIDPEPHKAQFDDLIDQIVPLLGELQDYNDDLISQLYFKFHLYDPAQGRFKAWLKTINVNLSLDDRRKSTGLQAEMDWRAESPSSTNPAIEPEKELYRTTDHVIQRSDLPRVSDQSVAILLFVSGLERLADASLRQRYAHDHPVPSDWLCRVLPSRERKAEFALQEAEQNALKSIPSDTPEADFVSAVDLARNVVAKVLPRNYWRLVLTTSGWAQALRRVPTLRTADKTISLLSDFIQPLATTQKGMDVKGSDTDRLSDAKARVVFLLHHRLWIFCASPQRWRLMMNSAGLKNTSTANFVSATMLSDDDPARTTMLANVCACDLDQYTGHLEQGTRLAGDALRDGIYELKHYIGQVDLPLRRELQYSRKDKDQIPTVESS